ncbi:MAG TPA: pyridoxamine 5'-phosphate oxidase family protein [Candidatus Margulisiibacteriota bacterium]|nr:pyridoxamine 5'-phosphate oxidase family protein [Candidatus Margulisiibacteriota bacterium]
MAAKLITDEVKEFLENRGFVSIGTSDANGQPCVVPKFLIAVEDDFIYIADFLIAPTFENIKVNPKVSLAAIDMDTLLRYQINGTAQIIDKGLEHDKLVSELRKRELNFTVERIVKGVQKEQKHKDFEYTFPERFVVIKIKVKDILKIMPNAKSERKNMNEE